METPPKAAVSPHPSARTLAFHTFERWVAGIKSKELAVTGLRLKARREALRERGRHLLLQATYVDLALSAADTPPFGAEAVINLKRHGFPFTALIALVTVQGIEPSLADPARENAQGSSTDSLRRRFEEIKKRAKELIMELQAVAKA